MSETSETIKTSETSTIGFSSEAASKNNKITAVEKSEKTERTKDPRKVELGKKLAKISKEAKERKARHREAIREKSEAELERKVDRDDRSLAEEINDYVDFRYIVGGVTIVAALGGLYYAYKSDKRLERSESEQSDRPKVSAQQQNELNKNVSGLSEKVKTINKNDFEITKCNRPSGSASSRRLSPLRGPKVQPSTMQTAERRTKFASRSCIENV